MVSGLSKGETYVFRVQAINELGLSEESQESAPITIKAALSQFSCLLHFCSPELIVTVRLILHFFQPLPPLHMTSHCWAVTATQCSWPGKSLFSLEAQTSRSIMWTREAAEPPRGEKSTSHPSLKESIRSTKICICSLILHIKGQQRQFGMEA